MKNIKKPSVLILALFIVTFVFSEPTKHALIIAVGNYPAEGGWSQISSANDVALINDVLLKQGFDSKNIKVIGDSQAKKENIVDELTRLSEKIRKGDIVVLHFSGHGQQIMDNNNDELDGYDESIIPYDANVYFSKNYHGENHLRDDELTVLLNGIREKLGTEGNILVILDSCHSGTATRGLAKSRGTDVKFEEPGYSPAEDEDKDNFAEIESSDGQENLAPMVLISGASQEELNYEYIDRNSEISYGSLSYSFSKALSEATPETTYRALFDKIKVEMNMIAPRQSPQIEGDIDMKLFGGGAVDQKPYFMVDEWLDDKTVTINAGNLMGLFDGSVVEFYDINTTNPADADAWATGTILNSSAVNSDIILDNPLSELKARDSWIFVTEQNFGQLKVKVKIANLKNITLEQQITKECEHLPSIELVNKDPELIIETLDKNKTIRVITADELEIFSKNIATEEPGAITNELVQSLKNYGQANLIKKIELVDPDLNVFFEILPITVKRSGSRWIEDQRLDIETKTTNGNLEFKDGDCFKIKVKNNGYAVAYYQILDIQPNNNINILVPNENRTASEYIIYMEKKKELGEIFVFGEPMVMKYSN
ncbi:MAG: caspase family protein [Bacteroidales bacterium]